MKKHGIILLAAGSSSRFGHAKQLANHDGESLIRHALHEAKKASENVIIVLGANIEMIKKEIEDFSVHLVHNKNWEEGMSSSIRCGLSDLMNEDPLISAVILMVCDQPFVTSNVLSELIAKHEETKKPIVASAYQDTIGTPVLFDRTFFPALLALTGQSGAKKIVSQNMGSTVTVPFPLGHIDIDTKEDYDSFRKNKFNS